VFAGGGRREAMTNSKVYSLKEYSQN